MTHDVETAIGVGFASSLMDMDDAHGIKSSFQAVPVGRYKIADDLVQEIRSRGFELNVHDFKHDGSLFQDHAQFLLQAKKINESVRNLQSLGFRSGAMYRKQEWFEAFDVSYDMSVPNVAHLEPQRGGCCTVMPYSIGKICGTTAHDDPGLFYVPHARRLFTRPLDTECKQILGGNGLISFIVHPDYVVEHQAGRLPEFARLFVTPGRRSQGMDGSSAGRGSLVEKPQPDGTGSRWRTMAYRRTG